MPPNDTEKSHTKISPKPSLSILDKVSQNQREIWEENQLTDYTIKVQNVDIQVHKLVIASGSDYFRALLTNVFKESCESSIALVGLNPTAVQALVVYIYTGKLEITLDNWVDLLQSALYLQIKEAVDDCYQFIYGNLRPETYCDILKVLRRFQLKDVEEKVIGVLCQNADAVVVSSFLESFQFEDAYVLFENWKGPCVKLLAHIKRWIESDESHFAFIVRLLSITKFPLMSLDQLQDIKKRGIFDEEKDKVWKHMVEEAIQYHQLPIWHKVLKQGPGYTSNEEAKLVALLTDDHNRETHELGPRYYTLENNDIDSAVGETDFTWKLHQLRAEDSMEVTWSASAVVYNNFLILAGGWSRNAEINKSCYIFDPRRQKWYKIASMIKQRAKFPLIAVGGKLYAIAGCFNCLGFDFAGVTEESEVYNIAENEWSPIPPLPIKLGFHAGLYLSGKIYVTGGETCENNDQPLADLENQQLFSFDVVTSVWETLAPMKYNRAAKLIPLNHKGLECILAFGIVHLSDIGIMEYYSPSINQWTEFNVVAKLGDSSRAYALHPTSNELYCMGGKEFCTHFSFSLDVNSVITRKSSLPGLLTDPYKYDVHIAAFLSFSE